MFSLKNFIKMGLLDAVGQKPIYWIVSSAAGWLDKGVLDEADLAEISAKIEEQYPTENKTDETEVIENV